MQDNSFTHSAHKRIMSEDDGRLSEDGVGALFPVVAIGAAAGGMDAVARLLEHLPPDLGMAYVILLYLSPGERGVMDLFQQRTDMKVVEACNNTLLEMNKVYVLPAENYLSIGIGRFVHLPVFRSNKAYHVIDHFFTTLAGIYKNNAYAVVLSGTGADGTAGIRAIRAEGGITFAQDATAAFRGMPQYAIESGFIDFVLPPEGIAGQLAALKDYSFRTGAILRHLENSKVQLGRIYLLLSGKYGVDFSLYKQSTVNRRIIRRMTLNKIPNAETYLKHLEADPAEIELLYKDLLSGVGGFFREPALGRVLVKKIFPALLKDRKPDEPVRVWIPACSGGEEACSMAIYLLEYMHARDIQAPIQIFATDLHEGIIEMARTGFYTKAAVHHLSPLRLKKFFIKIEGGYQVIKAIRDMCIFTSHNFLKDPPYARMDIISCRHALLSLEQTAQQKALRIFYYSLKQSGFLLLDRTDTFHDPQPFFQQAFKEWNIYTKRTDISSPIFDLPATILQSTRENNKDPQDTGNLPEKGKAADKIMLSRYVSAGLLVDGEGHILRFYGVTASYLRPWAGKATLELFSIVHESLVYELHDLLQQVKRHGVAASKAGIIVQTGQDAKMVTIDVVPVKQPGDTWLLIVFREPSPGGPDAGPGEDAWKQRILELEESLLEAGRQMLAMHDEFGQVRMELQAAHEELLSSNEELQSINEQLETSKEELQSTNEELTTMNEEVIRRNAELKESIEYAEAIVETIGQPLLDFYSDLRVRKANKSFYSFFRLTCEEMEGNYLSETANGLFNIPELMDGLRLAISRRIPFRELEWKYAAPDAGERIILFNATRINGQPGKRARILLAMEDITERRQLEKRKDEFISIASHELKMPATSIQAYAQILYNEFVEANDQQSAQLVGKLNKQVARLATLTRDLLDMSNISQGHLRLKESFFDIQNMVDETIEEMQRTTPIRLIFSRAYPVGNFWGDRDRLGQVLRNLISNAIKYSAGGTQVLIGLDMQEKHLHLCVQDFGIGMTPATQEKIFDRFFRVDDPAARQYSGLGLGLYISQEIVRQHGGKITVQSEKDKGSTFTVILPDRKEPFSMV